MADDVTRARRAAALRRFRARRRAEIDAHKGGPCADCGGSFIPYIMDFDHRPDETKHFNVSAGIVLGLSMETILEEIAKCDVVCANCHRLRTWRRTEAERLATPTPDRPPAAARTHCPAGHPYSGENLRVRRRALGMSRECVQCVRAADRQRGRDRRRASRPEPG